MRHNHTLQQIRQAKPAIGLWLQSHSFHAARIIAAQGLFDWLLVDMEHTPVDLSTTSMILAAIADMSAGNCTPLVRVAHNSMYHIKHALDAGAQGIVVPMINSAQEVADVLNFARFPPLGNRGGGGLLPHFSFGTPNHVEYLQQANEETLVAIQIETVQAVNKIDEILDVPGIDLVFLGPFDLHLSLGLTPTLWSDEPAFAHAVQRVIAACKQRNIPYGTIAPNADGVNARLADGFTFISMGSDFGQLLTSLYAQYQQVRTALE